MDTPFTKYIKDNLKTEELIGAEIGVMEGVNALYLLSNLPIKKLYLIDNYKTYFDGGTRTYPQEKIEMYYEVMLHAIEPYFEKTKVIRQDSVWATNLIPDGYLDFVYIDAGHSYDDVMSDMNAWWNKVKKGGVFGGHDYGTINGRQVYHAVNDFLEAHGIKQDPSIGMRVGEAMEWAIIK